MARKKTEVQVSQHNVSLLDTFRTAIAQLELTPEQELSISRELEAAGAASVAMSEAKKKLAILRQRINESKEKQQEKQIKAKLKILEKMQEIKTEKVIGVIQTMSAGRQINTSIDIVGLLEGGK